MWYPTKAGDAKNTHDKSTRKENVFFNQPGAGPLCHGVCLRLANQVQSKPSDWQKRSLAMVHRHATQFWQFNWLCQDSSKFIKISCRFHFWRSRANTSPTPEFSEPRVLLLEDVLKPATPCGAKSFGVIWWRNMEYAWLQLFVRHTHKNLSWHQFLRCFACTNNHLPSPHTHTHNCN